MVDIIDISIPLASTGGGIVTAQREKPEEDIYESEM
jgi:hypothetical protein